MSQQFQLAIYDILDGKGDFDMMYHNLKYVRRSLINYQLIHIIISVTCYFTDSYDTHIGMYQKNCYQ